MNIERLRIAQRDECRLKVQAVTKRRELVRLQCHGFCHECILLGRSHRRRCQASGAKCMRTRHRACVADESINDRGWLQGTVSHVSYSEHRSHILYSGHEHQEDALHILTLYKNHGTSRGFSF